MQDSRTLVVSVPDSLTATGVGYPISVPMQRCSTVTIVVTVVLQAAASGLRGLRADLFGAELRLVCDNGFLAINPVEDDEGNGISVPV